MIHIENLVKRYGDLVALNHLSLDIHEGEIFGLRRLYRLLMFMMHLPVKDVTRKHSIMIQQSK